MEKVLQIGIVGTGPRGLVALERLIAEMARAQTDGAIKLTLFEASTYPGCGPNYALDQPRCNQLNVPFREIPMPPRSSVDGDVHYDAFPSFQQWYKQRHDVADSSKDFFPARADIGRYLQERFQSVVNVNPLVVKVICEKVVAAERCGGQWHLRTKNSVQLFKLDDVLLAIGHQPTNQDQNLERWIEHSVESSNAELYLEPYPNQPLTDSDRIDSESVVALRGMGLSMIDIVKCLTVGRGGTFSVTDPARLTMQYRSSGREPKRIVPFSLDGQPMAPKPVNAAIDSHFDVPDATISALETALNVDETKFTGNDLHDLLIHWASKIASVKYVEQADQVSATTDKQEIDVGAIEKLAASWLHDGSVCHASITDTTQSIGQIMQQFLDMAMGNRRPSLDFCIGQVWRKLQPTFYDCLRFRQFDAEVIAPAVALDQRMKRYAFGPPAEAIAMLITLREIGVLVFKIADDPDVEVTDTGWKLRDGKDSVEANIMINTVLDQAQLTETNSELVIQINNQGYTEAVHESLGAKAMRDGSLIRGGKPVEGLTATGRLILGSVFEADALLACFGDDMTTWARGVMARRS